MSLSDERAALLEMCRDAGVIVMRDGKFGHPDYTSVQSSLPALEALARAVADAAIAADRAQGSEPVEYWVLIDPVARVMKMDSADASLMFFGSIAEAESACRKYGNCSVHKLTYYTRPQPVAVPEDAKNIFLAVVAAFDPSHGGVHFEGKAWANIHAALVARLAAAPASQEPKK